MTATNQGTILRYGTLFWRTLVYARQVRGTVKAHSSYLIAAPTTDGTLPPASDLFRLKAPDSGVTLQDYLGAFLTSPLFRLELRILKLVAVPRSLHHTLEPAHLEKVASHHADSFVLWKDRLAEGDPAKTIRSSEDATNPPAATRIMRCEPSPGEPFCDTWWSVEASRDVPNTVDLVFGTALLPPFSHSWALDALGPLHRLYSRFLLASARANLEVMRTP